MSTSRSFRATTAALLMLGVAAAAVAEKADTQPVRVIIPSAAGATPDQTMRMLTAQITKETGVAFVIENKPGGGGVVGMTDLAHASPDGKTIGYVNNVTLAINRSLYAKLPYDPEKLVPVTLLTKVANVIVVKPDLPIKTLSDLVRYAKQNPAKVSYASPGQGSSGHLSGELLATKAGIKMTHIPYRGSPQAITDLRGGVLEMLIDNLPNVLPHIQSGAFRAIAVTSLQRNPQLPDVPTIADSGYPGFEGVAWGGVAMPPGSSPAAAAKLQALFVKALNSEEAKNQLSSVGTEINPSRQPRDLQTYAAKETTKWADVIKQAGIEPQR